MDLFLKVVHSVDGSVTSGLSVLLTESGGNIGRSGECNLVLPDTEGYISRVHVKIEYDQGVFYVQDCSSNGTLLLEPIVENSRSALNEVFINKCRRPILDGGYLIIGDFEIQAQYSPNSKLVDQTAQDQDELLNLSHSSETPDVFSIEDFFVEDAVADSLEVDAEEDLFSGLKIPFVDDELEGVVEPHAEVLVDSALVEGEQLKQAAINKETMAFSEAEVEAIKKLQSTPSQLEEPSQSSVESNMLFFQALGLDVSKLPKDEASLAKLMAESGLMLRRLLETNISLLKARADLKKQFSSSLTVVQKRQNNPLKCCQSTEEALSYLFLEQVPGFLSRQQAIDESVNDLYTHQMALMAGTQAALKSTIDQFSPALIKQKTDNNRFNKSAKHWDFYQSNYKKMSKQAVSDFFGSDFASAYDRQVRAMKHG